MTPQKKIVIIAGIAPFQPETVAFRAGRLMLQELAHHSAAGRSFAFETTLSGRTYVSMIDAWRARFQLTQRERITLGVLAQTEGMTARELGAVLETEGGDALSVWLGRLQTMALVQTTGRTQGTRYFVDPTLLRGAKLVLPTTLLRIEPHRLHLAQNHANPLVLNQI